MTWYYIGKPGRGSTLLTALTCNILRDLKKNDLYQIQIGFSIKFTFHTLFWPERGLMLKFSSMLDRKPGLAPLQNIIVTKV